MSKDFFSQLSDGSVPPKYRFFNGEKWSESYSNQFYQVVSPVDEEIIGEVPQLTRSEIDRAIEKAVSSQKNWVEVPLIKRVKVLHLAADWMREHEPLLTKLLILEIGKCHHDAKDEVVRSADMLDYFAQAALNLQGEELSGEAFPGYDGTKTAHVQRVPRGVILAISPFNYPVNLSVSKIAPALALGNAVVLKSASWGSISALHLTQIFYLAGLPKGLLFTATGSGEKIGEHLVTHPKIDMVAFTGSSKVGRKIAKGGRMIPLLLECGGNNPAIVLPDAQLDETADEIVKGAFSYSGQRCTSIKYVLGFENTIDKLLPLVVKKTRETVKIGNPSEKTSTMGPVISDIASLDFDKKIILAKKDGARVVYGGTRKGKYIDATIIEHARPYMEIVSEEVFAPVLSFIKVKSMEEIFKIINQSVFGLQASVFTKDEGAGIKIAGHIDVGTVQINGKPQRGPDNFPFLGVKASGLGVQGVKYSLEAMTRIKSVVLNKPH